MQASIEAGSGPMRAPNGASARLTRPPMAPGLHPHAPAAVERLDTAPAVADVHQQAVGDRLAGQAGAGRPERHRNARRFD